MDNTSGSSLLIVTHIEGKDDARIEREVFNHGEAHAAAEEVARKMIGKGAIVAVYRRIATYEAEVKVAMKKEGE